MGANKHTDMNKICNRTRISMPENKDFAPKIFTGEDTIHEVVYSSTTHENIRGEKIMPGARSSFSSMEISFSCMEISFSCMEISFLCMDISFLCMEISFSCMEISFSCMEISFSCIKFSHAWNFHACIVLYGTGTPYIWVLSGVVCRARRPADMTPLPHTDTALSH